MLTLRTDCPCCHAAIDGRAKPHCEGKSCGWILCPECKARIGKNRHACNRKDCQGAGGNYL